MRRDHLGIQDRREVESRAAMEGSRKGVDSREGGREGERETGKGAGNERFLADAFCLNSKVNYMRRTRDMPDYTKTLLI